MDTDKFGLLGKVLEAKGEIDRWVNALIERRLSGQLLRWSLRISFLWFGALHGSEPSSSFPMLVQS